MVVLLVCLVPVAVLVAAACSRAPAAGGGVVGADAGDAEASENDAIDVTGVLLDLSGDDVLKCFLTGGKIEAASLRESLESCGAPSPGAKIETPALPGLERALRARRSWWSASPAAGRRASCFPARARPVIAGTA